MRIIRRLTRMSDADLIARSRRSPEAFRTLCERHAPSVHGFLLRRTQDQHAAYELTAETLARAWVSRESFVDRAGGKALPWLLGIARNVVADSVRKSALERHALERLRITGATEPTETQIDERWLDGLDEDLSAALAGLSDEQREAIALRVVEEREYDDVARRLGCSEGAARGRVFRALGRLRKRLAEPSAGVPTTGGDR